MSSTRGGTHGFVLNNIVKVRKVGLEIVRSVRFLNHSYIYIKTSLVQFDFFCSLNWEDDKIFIILKFRPLCSRLLIDPFFHKKDHRPRYSDQQTTRFVVTLICIILCLTKAFPVRCCFVYQKDDKKVFCRKAKLGDGIGSRRAIV